MVTDNNYLAIWTIYNSPEDYPGLFVARKWLMIDGVETPTNEGFASESLEVVRAHIPPGLILTPRSEQDDPVIVESWL